MRSLLKSNFKNSLTTISPLVLQPRKLWCIFLRNSKWELKMCHPIDLDPHAFMCVHTHHFIHFCVSYSETFSHLLQDQRMPDQRTAKCRCDPLDDSPFSMRDVNSRSAMLGVHVQLNQKNRLVFLLVSIDCLKRCCAAFFAFFVFLCTLDGAIRTSLDPILEPGRERRNELHLLIRLLYTFTIVTYKLLIFCFQILFSKPYTVYVFMY